jgi:chaperonin cofactor prefoldin
MTLFIPSSRLLIAVGDNQNGQKLALASSEWFDLQNRVQAILALPSNFGEYQTRYGDASSGSQMKDCFDAMLKLRRVATKYGNPMSLRANILKNPNFLAGVDRPKNDSYSAIVWTLERAHQNAFGLASILKGIPINARGESPSDVVTGIKSLFLDTDQMVDQMQQTVNQLDALVNELQAIEDELADAQLAMETFTARSSQTMTNLDQEIGGLKDKIAQLEIDRNAAYAKWLELTIAACGVSAIIALVGLAASVILAAETAGVSLIVGAVVTTGVVAVLGSALGIAAGIARTDYDNLVSELSTKGETLQKRVAYRHDLGALDELMKFSLPSSSGLISQVRLVRESWIRSMQEIRFKVADLSVDSLKSGPWLKEQEMAAAAANWIKVDDAIKAFILGSFVDYQLVDFGKPLPKDDPDWQNKLASKLAA